MIETIYEELRTLGVVRNCDEFSRDWLGMEKSYMRVMRAKRRLPSAKAMARCISKLKNDSRKLIAIDRPGYGKAAARLDTLAQKCLDEMLRAHKVL